MNRAIERRIERAIAEATVDALLKVGPVTVVDGVDIALRNSTDRAAILAAMFTTDEDKLIVDWPNANGRAWAHLIHGNGADILSNYSASLESVLRPVQKLSERIEEGHFDVLPQSVEAEGPKEAIEQAKEAALEEGAHGDVVDAMVIPGAHDDAGPGAPAGSGFYGNTYPGEDRP